MSPTQRSLKKLRAEGYFVAIVEHWNPHAFIRQDLFGFIDLLAIRGNETLGVQTTSGAHTANRKAKILTRPMAKEWLRSPTRRVVVHGWRKLKTGWACREEEVVFSDFPQEQEWKGWTEDHS